MALTGLPDDPMGPPAGLVEGIDRIADSFPGLDALALLGERAALMGLWRRGTTSCGGSCHLLPSGDGFMAVSLPRAEDMETVPAWLELDDVPESVPAMWSSVASHLQQGDPDLLLARAQLLGLPVAIVGESAGHVGVVRSLLGEAPPRPDPTGDLSGLIVVDLSALWAGPLCGDFLARAGATVVKVESTQRPDGARRGPSEFFDLLNGRKRSVVLDFQSRDGIRILHDLVRSADVVIEASRPRALTQFGLDGPDLVRSGGPQIWVSITGHGREGEAGNRVAFGDDAAAAGGLVVWRNNVPLFCADAIADPLTGLTAADACLRALAEGGRWLLSVSMSAMSSAFSGPTLPTPPDLAVAPPRARPVETPAPPSGADTARVLAELEIDP
jgi:hypothetical protein